MKTINFFVKTNWGNDHFYIENEPFKTNVEALTGRKTLNAKDFTALENLGFTFEEVLNPERIKIYS